MARKNAYDPTDMVRQQENIRKARGNPNKNVHAGKKNSHYGGYTSAPAPQESVKRTVSGRERIKLTPGLRALMLADFAVVLVLVVLRLAVFPENKALSYVTTVMLGATCALLFYIRRSRTKEQEKDRRFQIVQGLLAVIAVVYIGLGGIGLLSLAGILPA